MNTTARSATPTHRSRWAALGAAIAVSLGAGGLGIARATSPEGATTYVAITPCRLIDTRSDATFHVGPHATLGADTHIAISGWGAQGQCAAPAPDLPSGTTGLQLNVTAVDAAAATFLAVYPGTGTPPNASSLNPTPGAPPTPNAVTTQLDGSGTFSVYNLAGTVDVIVDVVGYYTEHQHTGDDIVDGSLTGADLADESLSGADIADESLTGAEIANDSLSSADSVDESGLAARTTLHNPLLQLTNQASTIGEVRLRVPADGYVTVFATIRWNEATGGHDVADCTFRLNGEAPETGRGFRLHDFGYSGNWNSTTTGHQTFKVSPSGNVRGPLINGHHFTVTCNELDGAVGIESVMVTAQYFPTWYSPSPAFTG